MWNVKVKVIRLIIGATRIIWKSFRQYLSNMAGRKEIKELQIEPTLGTAHTVRKVLMSKYNTYFTGEITLHVAQIVNTELLLIYVP